MGIGKAGPSSVVEEEDEEDWKRVFSL